MKMTGYEYKIYTDFKQAIKETAAEYNIAISEYMFRWIMTRVDQNIVKLYEEWGVNDTEFVNALQSTVKEALLMKGYHREIFR